MCSHCCLFYLFLCFSAATLCSSVCFSSLDFSKTAVKSNLLSSISPWQAERTMKRTEDMTALWPSVRHPQIGPRWSYTSPVQEGGCRMFFVFISPSPMTVSLWMPRLLLPVNHFRALTWGEAAEALSCKIGLC